MPETLEIPPQLVDWRFVLIHSGEKAPFEEAWQRDANYASNDPTLLAHLEAGGNYGVLGSREHFIIDVDNQTVKGHPEHQGEAKKILDKVKAELPPTFTVRTANKGLHFYYTTNKNGLRNAIRLTSTRDSNVNLGDIQGPDKQSSMPVSASTSASASAWAGVGPGSIVNGKKYTVARDIPIAKIPRAEQTIRELFTEHIQNVQATEATKTPKDTGKDTGKEQPETPKTPKTPKTPETPKTGEAPGAPRHRIQLPTDPDDLTDLKITPRELAYQEALTLLDRHRLLCTIDDDTLHYYKDGIWLPEADQLARRETGKDLGDRATSHLKNEVIRHLKDTARPIHRTDLNQNPHLIPVQNGVINISRDPPTLQPHSPDNLFTIQLPVQYDPAQDGHEYLDFINQVMNQLDAQITTETIGYCLWRRYPWDTAWMGLGEGRNGKTTLLNTVTELLGKTSVSHQSLQSITDNRFAAHRLTDKLANIYPDIPDKGLKETGIFKATTGGDIIDVEQKYKDPFQTELYTKQIYSANTLPRTPDLSDAWMRRWRIIRFPNKYVENNPDPDPDQKEYLADPHLEDKLRTPQALSGLLNLAITALKTAQKRGHIQNNQTLQQMRDQWQRESDPIQAYIDEQIDIGEGELTRDQVYRAYCKYCNQMHRPAIRKQSFDKNFQQRSYAIPYRSSTKGRPQMWQGVSYKTTKQTKMSDLSDLSDQNQQKIQKTEQEKRESVRPVTPVRPITQEDKNKPKTGERIDRPDKSDKSDNQQTHRQNPKTTNQQKTEQFTTWLKNRSRATLTECTNKLETLGHTTQEANDHLVKMLDKEQLYEPKPGWIAVAT